MEVRHRLTCRFASVDADIEAVDRSVLLRDDLHYRLDELPKPLALFWGGGGEVGNVSRGNDQAVAWGYRIGVPDPDKSRPYEKYAVRLRVTEGARNRHEGILPREHPGKRVTRQCGGAQARGRLDACAKNGKS
jgi:hypothetical protein